MSKGYVNISRRGLLGSAKRAAVAVTGGRRRPPPTLGATGAAAVRTTAVVRPGSAGADRTGTQGRPRPRSVGGVHRHPLHPPADPLRRPGRLPRRGGALSPPPRRAPTCAHYGAVADDGTTDCAPAINRAIAAAGKGRRRHGYHPARHVPHRRRDPRRPLERRPARRRQRPHQAVRDQEPHRADRRLRLPLRRRQVVLVLGGRPDLAVPAEPLHARSPTRFRRRPGPSRAGPATSATSGRR